MKTIKTMIWFFVIALGMGVSVLSLPQNVNAQNDNDKKEKKQASKDDDKDKGEKLSSLDKTKAKISMEVARATALNRVNGTVVEEDLEKENGRLQYAFDIRDNDGKIWDVEIDAMSGAVLKADNEEEDDDDDDDEIISPEEKKSVSVTMTTARATALHRVPGTVIDEELEKENGKLQYAFDIRDRNGKVWDVEIDAITGEVLKAKPDDEEDDDDGTVSGKSRAVAKRVKNAAVKTARVVKNAAVKTVGKVF